MFQRPIEIQGVAYNVDEDSEVCTQCGGGNGERELLTPFFGDRSVVFSHHS